MWFKMFSALLLPGKRDFSGAELGAGSPRPKLTSVRWDPAVTRCSVNVPKVYTPLGKTSLRGEQQWGSSGFAWLSSGKFVFFFLSFFIGCKVTEKPLKNGRIFSKKLKKKI